MAIVVYKEHLSTLEECEAEVDNILDEMGGEGDWEDIPPGAEIRAATRAFIIKDFKAHTEVSAFGELYLVSEAEVKAWAFIDGYEACLKR